MIPASGLFSLGNRSFDQRAGFRFAIAAGLALLVAACAKVPLATAPVDERAAIEANLMRDISVLASDEFGGRRPGTDGERLTVQYLIEQMQDAGFTSGTNDPGSAWRAAVPLVSTAPRESTISFVLGDSEATLQAEQAAAFTTGSRALINGLDVVFVGKRGAVEGSEIAGKVVLMLGEPGVSPRRRAQLFEMNPAAIITIVEDEAAIANVQRIFGRERLILASEEERRLTVFVTDGAMREALGEARWSDLLASADKDDFAPVTLDQKANIDARTNRREFTSANVIGLLPGQVRGSGAVVLMGHWDHLGECGSEEAGDLICNGAIDNASGIAVMLELARRLSATGPHDRDIYLLATSAEEAGLLGAKAFVEQPPVPLDTIVGVFNFDTVAIAPAGSPVGFIGEGETPLDPIILEVLADSERQLGNQDYANQFVRRQDGWIFLQEGVPSVFLSTAFGSQITLGPYLSSDYHRPSDEIEKIQLGGAIDDLLLHEELIRRIADTEQYSPPSGQ